MHDLHCLSKWQISNSFITYLHHLVYFIAEHWVVIYMQCSFLRYIRVCEVCGYCSYIESSSADICVCQHQECDMTQLQLWLLLVWCASPSNSSKPQHHLQKSWTVFCCSCRASSQSDLQNAAMLQNSQRMGIFVKYQIFSCCGMYFQFYFAIQIELLIAPDKQIKHEDDTKILPSAQEMCRKTCKLLLKVVSLRAAYEHWPYGCFSLWG